MPTDQFELISIGWSGATLLNGIVGNDATTAPSAIDSIVKVENTLLEYVVQGVTEGIDAVGNVTVRILGGPETATTTRINAQTEAHGRLFHGHGADTDSVLSAYGFAPAELAELRRLGAI